MSDAALNEVRGRVQKGVAATYDGGRLTSLEPLTGGASSLTYVADVEHGGGREKIVVKVAPPGLAPVRNRDVLRQARVQRALNSSGRWLTPPVQFEDAGDPPEAPPFMAMQLLPGRCVEPALTVAEARPTAAQTHARFLDAARMLARIHAVVPAEVGLAEEPVMTLEAEIARWVRAFETVPPELQGDFRTGEAALLRTVPGQLPPVINHGDYRLGNTLCEGASVVAVIDWEIWSVGDPRVDVTWLTFFTDEAAHPASEPCGPAGSPSRAELVAAYEAVHGTPLPDMVWFDALTKYKEAAATALLLKRALKAGRELNSRNQKMLPAVPNLVREAIDLVS